MTEKTLKRANALKRLIDDAKRHLDALRGIEITASGTHIEIGGYSNIFLERELAKEVLTLIKNYKQQKVEECQKELEAL